ncbi:MAG TPA: Crp/Fnr family transcriptional regulator [Parapedobacter sp.]|uniref:Crp/Fnr family transcriptional regulator n=1 Tax=Parapedobacter sp. TaxID=1958893 RepID=UPI002CB79D02|nr:Crp/Fnr family transcriptional regulator [Parapedobacter sp.]HWK58516.1 Crp/Fnr family transcriptional regulator [Parapedobacter sp.]
MAGVIPNGSVAPEAMEAILTRGLAIPHESFVKLTDIIRVIDLPKGNLLFSAGKLERDIYFMVRGIARVYYHRGDHTTTLCFNSEGEVLISLKSYIENQPGYENIELLEPSRLLQLKTGDLDKLYTSDIHVANWGRRLAEQELIKTEERLMSKLFNTASERYRELMQKQPQLLQRVQLGYIASYLGISQVTLSRIRADIK